MLPLSLVLPRAFSCAQLETVATGYALMMQLRSVRYFALLYVTEGTFEHTGDATLLLNGGEKIILLWHCRLLKIVDDSPVVDALLKIVANPIAVHAVTRTIQRCVGPSMRNELQTKRRPRSLGRNGPLLVKK